MYIYHLLPIKRNFEQGTNWLLVMELLSYEMTEWLCFDGGTCVHAYFFHQMCGVAVLSLGVYLIVEFKMTTLTPDLASFSIPNMLLISGIIITCVSFLGFLGALKENRCLLLTVWHTQHPLVLLWLCCCFNPSANFYWSAIKGNLCSGQLKFWIVTQNNR